MRRNIFTICLLLFLSSNGYPAADAGDLVEEMENGSINWTRGTVRAVGFGRASAGSEAPAAVLISARENAVDRLFEVVREVRIDSARRIGNLVETPVLAGASAMIRNAQVRQQEYLSNGDVKVTVEMSLFGGFAQLVLPEEIRQIDSIKAVSQAQAPGSAAGGSSHLRAAEPAQKAGEAYTGIAVDARGFEVRPTLSPRLIDEKGQEVYGAAFASREYAVQQGMSLYMKDLETAQSDPRIAGNPLTIRGLSTIGPGGADLVIGNGDAAKIRSVSENLAMLRQCRVIIVID
jgi:hypothetical protein